MNELNEQNNGTRVSDLKLLNHSGDVCLTHNLNRYALTLFVFYHESINIAQFLISIK